MSELRPGLYDRLVDSLVRAQVDRLDATRLRAQLAAVDAAELPDRIAEVAASWVRSTVRAVTPDERAGAAVDLLDELRTLLGGVVADAVAGTGAITAPVERLTAVSPVVAGDVVPLRQPLTPLRDTVLMTNGRGQPAVGHEIAAEIDSADRIDVVLAFIRWTGIRDLLDPLRRHVEAGKPVRVITTTYTGSTELRALEALRALGAQVKVSYDTSTTRLHAKAWHFHRDTGFSTVYIGSSNLTFSAQVTGLEWNVRASQRTNPELVDAFDRAFSTYWADPHFEHFDAARFRVATAATVDDTVIATPFDIEPYPFQRQILERLEIERLRGHRHNLVAAATGTGKTVIAALDYRNLRKTLPRARLLFVAHREEILRQSQTVFCHVLRDGAFGEQWVGGRRPQRWDHVFASIQSISAADVESIDPEHFDVVIVDEFHHAAASTYTSLLDHLKPKHLLGLTATPERADGLDVLQWFGGRIAVELRLWDALEQGLLSPFHYFGIHDGTDLRGVRWRRGIGYDTDDLTNLYTADHAWVSMVLNAVRDKVGVPSRMRALGFCVSIAHAEFMADRFAAAGLSAVAVTSRSTSDERRQALHDLRDGTVNIVFTVDLFNEGVDVPAVDVVLMLRPTESATVFLQQLGRGLRRSRDKDVLTVLDFVGHQRKEFRFDLRFRSMLGRTRREFERDIEDDFAFLPAGCRLRLDPVARDIVLRNVREAIPSTWRARVTELRSSGDVPLARYLDETGLDLDDLYRNGRTWTQLRRDAGFDTSSPESGEEAIARGFSRLTHVDDQIRIDTYRRLLEAAEPPVAAELDGSGRRMLEGLLLTVLPRFGKHSSFDAAVRALWRHTALRSELLEMLSTRESAVNHVHRSIAALPDVALQTHASYTREEVLAAFGASTVEKRLELQTGVYFHQPSNTDLFFITLQKSDQDYSPTTRYLDYAISDRLFHWETQSTTSVDSAVGQRYLHHVERGSHVALFIRLAKTSPSGRTMPYFCAGTAKYVEHRSDRPIQITWRLDVPLPGDVFAEFRAAVA
jgi:superfamily II DNA or RNA helicase/HKD family nuclease